MKNRVYLFILMIAGIFIFYPWNVREINSPALTHLEVQTDGGQGNFNLSSGKKSFTFGFSNSTNFANIIAEASDPSYQITGAGKVEVSNGLNVLNVIVTDPSDNTSETYTINLNFSLKSSSSNNITNPKTSTDNTNSSTTGVVAQNPETGAFVNVTIMVIITVLAYLVINKVAKNKKFYHI